MSKPNVAIRRLKEIRLINGSGQLKLLQPPQRCNLLPDCGKIGDHNFVEILEDVLYGTSLCAAEGTASVEFEGSKPVVVERDLAANTVRLLVGGEVQELANNETPGEFTFGLNRPDFHRAFVVETRDFIVPAGSAALQTFMKKLLVPEQSQVRTSKPAPTTDDLQTTRARRISLEKQLELMPEAKGSTPYEPVDPPSINRLLSALEDTRVTEKRLLERRISLAEALKKTANSDHAELLPTTAPILSQLEKFAAQMEEIDSKTAELRKSAANGTGFAARASIIIGLMISAGAAATGQILNEPFLTQLGVALAVIAVGGVIGLWLMRMNRIVSSTRSAKEFNAKRTLLREKSSKLALRVGTAAAADDLSPESIRTLVDRVGRRDIKKILTASMAPYIDTESELANSRKVAQALQTPLAEAAEFRDPSLPEVPLVRVTRSVMGVLTDWTRALEESRRRVEVAVTNRVRSQVERELVEQSLVKMRATERTLELNQGRKTKPKTDPIGRAAMHLNREVVPFLQRHLGTLAPNSFDRNLAPQFDEAPTSEVNSFVALAVKLFNPGAANTEIQPLGQLIVDPGLAVGAHLETSFGRLLAHSPLSGVISVCHSRPELEGSFARNLSLELGSVIGLSVVEDQLATGDSELYSEHDRPTQPAAGPLDLLLKSASD